MATEITVKRDREIVLVINFDIRNLPSEVKRLLDLLRDGWVNSVCISNLLGWYFYIHRDQLGRGFHFRAISTMVIEIDQDFDLENLSVSDLIKEVNSSMKDRLFDEEFYVEQLENNGFTLDSIDQQKIEKYRELCTQNFKESDFVN